MRHNVCDIFNQIAFRVLTREMYLPYVLEVYVKHVGQAIICCCKDYQSIGVEAVTLSAIFDEQGDGRNGSPMKIIMRSLKDFDSRVDDPGDGSFVITTTQSLKNFDSPVGNGSFVNAQFFERGVSLHTSDALKSTTLRVFGILRYRERGAPIHVFDAFKYIGRGASLWRFDAFKYPGRGASSPSLEDHQELDINFTNSVNHPLHYKLFAWQMDIPS